MQDRLGDRMLRVQVVGKWWGLGVAVVEIVGLAAAELALVAVGSARYSGVPLAPDARLLITEKIHRQKAL
jgi:hypothetical protein